MRGTERRHRGIGLSELDHHQLRCLTSRRQSDLRRERPDHLRYRVGSHHHHLGSGTTEEYITVCALGGDTTAADATGGPTYPFNFTATGAGGNGSTAAPSGTLTVTAATPKASACIDPATAGSTVAFNSSSGGTANSYTTECYAESGVTGVTAYPASVTPTGGTGLPGDATFGGNGPTSACGIGSGATTTTSGSGTTEEYITECAVGENAVSADNGTYTSNFQSSAAGATASGLADDQRHRPVRHLPRPRERPAAPPPSRRGSPTPTPSRATARALALHLPTTIRPRSRPTT